MTLRLKTLILLLVFGLVYTNTFAQKYNSFAGVRYGWALPMGEMASHEYGYGGYALLGKSYGAEAAWFITPEIGFGADISFNSFGFAAGYYAEDYKESEPSINKVDMLSGPYKIVTYMAGPYYKVQYSPRLRSTFKLMGGLMNARTPDQFYGADVFFAGKLYFWKTGSSDSRFTFLTGASFEYKLYDQVSLLLQADFTYAQMAFAFSKGSSGYVDHLHMPVFRLQPGINIHF